MHMLFRLDDYAHTSGTTLTHLTFQQACSQGGASDCKAPSTYLDTHTKNLQHIKHKHADQPVKQL